MTELMIVLTAVAALTALGIALLHALLDDPRTYRRPPQSHPDDEFRAGAHHRDAV